MLGRSRRRARRGSGGTLQLQGHDKVGVKSFIYAICNKAFWSCVACKAARLCSGMTFSSCTGLQVRALEVSEAMADGTSVCWGGQSVKLLRDLPQQVRGIFRTRSPNGGPVLMSCPACTGASSEPAVSNFGQVQAASGYSKRGAAMLMVATMAQAKPSAGQGPGQ